MTDGRGGSELRCLSVFTGAGGLGLGLEAAGFAIVGCVEVNRTCRDSLKLNRGGWRHLFPHDVSEFVKSLRRDGVPDDLTEIDVLAGGPPCQPFSKAAQWRANGRSGLADPRAEPLRAFLGLVDLLTPRALLLENVVGFVRGRSSALSYIEAALDDINGRRRTSYELTATTLNAADFGVPQRRERAIIVAFRNGQAFSWPAGTHRDDPVTAWDALHDLDVKEPAGPTGKWAELLPTIPEGKNYIWHTNRGEGSNLFGYRTRFWSFLLKLAKDAPAWTLPANPGPSTGPFHWDGRPLAPQEALRLQSFPMSWQLAGTVREQLRQVGNATPPLLAEVIGRSLALELVPKKSYPCEPTLCVPRSKEPPPPPAMPEQVPKRFRHLMADHPDHPGVGMGPNPVS